MDSIESGHAPTLRMAITRRAGGAPAAGRPDRVYPGPALADPRHPRRIGEGQVSLILEGLGRGDLDLPGATLRVVIQGLLTADRHRWHKSFFVKELCYLSRSLLSSITKLIMCWNSWVNVLGSTLFPVRCARPSGVVAAAGGACDERPRHDV